MVAFHSLLRQVSWRSQYFDWEYIDYNARTGFQLKIVCKLKDCALTHALQIFDSPIGPLYLIDHDGRLAALTFSLPKEFVGVDKHETPLLRRTKLQLSEYFCGERRLFDLPLALQGTAFQQKVWAALQAIPYGQTITYKDQATMVKAPQAVRAVGRTNGLNQLAIVRPCHRVIGSNGRLTGYAGGLAVKAFLLKLEHAQTIRI